ncbi:MAG: HepT-like ribonuclease domain-containing protein [Candidatus Rokuibacteriota bacterium]
MRHMLDHAREVVVMVRGRTRRDFDTDRMFQLALTRLVEIVGQAATRVTPAGHERYPAIPWAKVVSTRDRILHPHDIVNYDVVWDIVTLEIPTLVPVLERALPGHVS